MDDLRIALLEVLGDELEEGGKIGSIIIKKKNGIRYALEDKVIKTLADVNEKAYEVSITDSCQKNDQCKDIELLEV